MPTNFNVFCCLYISRLSVPGVEIGNLAAESQSWSSKGFCAIYFVIFKLLEPATYVFVLTVNMYVLILHITMYMVSYSQDVYTHTPNVYVCAHTSFV